MPVNIKFLKALHGDCILVTVTDPKKITRILIDGGPALAYRAVPPGNPLHGDLKRVLEKLQAEGQRINLVLLTHVDDDHIAGLIKAFESPDGLSKMADQVFFNSGRLIHEYFQHVPAPEKNIAGNFNQSQSTSISQGDTLEDLVTRQKIWHRQLVMQGNDCRVGPCLLRFLGPDKLELGRLLEKWEKERVSQNTSAARTDWKKSHETLLTNDVFEPDDSKTNGSSLSFILSVGEFDFLFLGDAHASTVVEGLLQRGYSESHPLSAELVKVSHHGSQYNTSVELLKLLRSTRFVISTDASKHGLPNKITLARIHTNCKDSIIYFNYKNVIGKVFCEHEAKALGLRLQEWTGDITFD